jgi:hypothetical protein
MALNSNLFAGDPRLEACAASNPDHVTPGTTGPHVSKIQAAVMVLDDAAIDETELDTSSYGPSTAQAVLAYKRKRDIVNRSYQTQADNIVGIMTIKSMDDELVAKEVPENPRLTNDCQRIFPSIPVDKSQVTRELLSEARRTSNPTIANAVRGGRDS